MISRLIIGTTLLIASTCSAAAPIQDWYTEYHQESRHETSPEQTLLEALRRSPKSHAKNRKAIDLGCGTGKDTLYLLKRGWNVLAHDGEARALEILRKRTTASTSERLKTLAAPFGELQLPQQADLVNASYSLPYCPPTEFAQCWSTVVDSLATDGQFAGQFFGDRDEWADDSTVTTLSKTELMAMLSDFDIQYFDEEEGRANGRFWHVFHVVAKKRAA